MCRKQNIWIKLKRSELRVFFGSRCNNPFCQSLDNLEFAHLTETEIKGHGRGLHQRILDVNKNRDKYILLCKTCHMEFDNNEIV